MENIILKRAVRLTHKEIAKLPKQALKKININDYAKVLMSRYIKQLQITKVK